MALIKNTAQLKEHYPVGKNLNFDTISHSIDSAQDSYILPVLGADQLDILQAAVDSNTFTPELTALLNKTRRALAQLAMYIAIPKINVHLSDLGVMKAVSEEFDSAAGAEVYFTRTQCLIDGYKAIDELYRFLESNKTDYPVWAISDAYSEYQAYFVNNASLYGKYTGISSRWVYCLSIADMDTQEQLRVKGVLGDEFFAELKSNFADGSASAEELALIELLKKPIALYTYAASLTNPNVRETLRIITANTPEQLTQKNVTVTDYKAEYAALAEEKIDEANALMAQVKKYLDNTASATVYSTYFDSDEYTDPTSKEGRINHYNNRESDGTFVLM